MTEREIIKKILERVGITIYYEDENSSEFDGSGYETIVIEFNEAGFVTDIY